MKSVDQMDFHPTSESIVDVLCQRTQNNNREFFRILTSYHVTRMASMMRVKVASKGWGKIPVNMYGLNLAPSGNDKGHSTNIIEEHVINEFKTVFFDNTYPLVVEENLAKLATKRALLKEIDPDTMLTAVQKEFEALGSLPFSFDSATTAALKQTRHKLLMADIGAMNLEIDEIGSNLLGNVDVLTTCLELFDVGKVKPKLTKNTKENVRNEDIDGKTPMNLMMFGTPSKLLNGKVEDEFYSMLETGYARRCFFGYTRGLSKERRMTPQEIYDAITDNSKIQLLNDIAVKFGQLANIINYDKVITMKKDIALILIDYRSQCEIAADQLPEHEEIMKAELRHRYFKAMKLAGSYAFVDGESEMKEEHLYAAIRMAEESGKALKEILKRDRNYVKLAKYIASCDSEVTHVDLTEDLPFYKGSAAQKADLMMLAIAWGYKHHIIIKRQVSNGIEFLRGETLKSTDLDKIRLSYSDHIADNYRNVTVPFTKLHQLTQKANMHWITHHLTDGHRHEESIINGFNMIVVDVDGGITLDAAKSLLQEYTGLVYTTKRHTPDENRFRVVLPINYFLELDQTEFKEFMSNIFEWLPFEVDKATGQRARKWLTHPGHYEYLPGDKLLDALEFIPKTSKNDERKKVVQSMQSLSNLERWFVSNTGIGNRSNQLIRYALMLVDMGADFNTIRNSVLNLNAKIQDPLTDAEITTTIMTTVSKALTKVP